MFYQNSSLRPIHLGWPCMDGSLSYANPFTKTRLWSMKRAFLNEQCKEIEENNRMRKTRDLVKKIGDIKATFHARMGTIKDSKDLTEAEEIKQRWQNYTELPAYLTSMQRTSWETLGWRKHKLESRLPGEISITSDIQMTPPLKSESEEELKSLWMKVKEESEKVGLKFNIQKTKIMASGPITSWEIDGETLADFISGGSKITADGDCSQEIKKHLLLGRKVMTNLDSILKSRDITLPIKVRLVKALVFPVVMYGCKSWTVKKAECRRTDAFELWCWRRLLRVPWTARRSNQSILKEISPGYSLEGLMLKLKLRYFGHLMQRVDSLEKT